MCPDRSGLNEPQGSLIPWQKSAEGVLVRAVEAPPPLTRPDAKGRLPVPKKVGTATRTKARTARAASSTRRKMNDRRQNTREEIRSVYDPLLRPPSAPGVAGEARTSAGGGVPAPDSGRVESLFSPREDQSPTSPLTVMQEVLQPDNLEAALARVQANKGSAGVDGMTVARLPDHLRLHWPRIRRQLLEGTYQPQPVKRVEIPKPDGGVRKLGIPTVLDRFIQQAVQQVLTRRWDGTFSPSSFGFRPGKSAHQAVEAAQRHIAGGCGWVVDIDLEKFFDRVNHDRLMGRIMQRENDKALIRLIRSFLTAGVMEDGLVSPTDEGAPQGGPLSPLLSNLVLDELDKELERRGHPFVRYADDCNIYVRSERAGRRVMEGVSAFITRKLKLKVNASKSAVARPRDRKFLSFSFTSGKNVKRRIAPKAVQRFKAKVRELTHRHKGQSLRQMIGPLGEYLRGWRGYFGFCQTPGELRSLDEWIRRRLRCVVLRHWATGRRRYAELIKRGVDAGSAARIAGSGHGPWRLSRSRGLHVALPNRFWDWLGLPRVAATG
jgi:RNA-directed DNA polymerase